MSTSDKTDITVLMAVYNGARFLRASLESVLRQSFKNFEFIIVDDCSTDDTANIINSYKDTRIKLYKNEVNKGQTLSLNIGLRKAKGKYIARMDTDDIAFPDWLGKVYTFAEANPEYCVVSPRAIVIDENDRIKQTTRPSLSFNEILMTLLTESPLNHVGSLMRLKEMLDMGGYNERFAIAADYALWSSLVLSGHKLINMPGFLTAIRIYSASQGQRERSQKGMTEMVEIIRHNISRFTDYKINSEDIELIWGVMHNMRGFEDVDFRNIDRLMENIYNSLKDSVRIPEIERENFKKQKKQEIYMRKVFICIQKKKYELVRQILRDYVKKNGYCSICGLIYIIFLFRLTPVNFEKLYFNLRAFVTRVKLIDRLKYIANNWRESIV